MSAAELFQAAAQLLFAVAVGWVVGERLVALVAPRARANLTDGAQSARSPAVAPEGFGLPERALMSLAGFVVFAVSLMVGQIVTGGAVFGYPGVVTVAGVAVVAWGARARSWPRGVPWGKVLLAVVVLGALWAWPAIAGGTTLKSGDVPWHMGWTSQLLGGEPVPPGPAPELARNAYPWGLHAVLATLTRLVPGSSMVAAFDALDGLLLVTFPLVAACLARLVRREAGWAAAGCATLVGGFGWVAARKPVFFTSTSDALYGADLVVASPNGVYALLPPALPRELGLVLLGCVALLVARVGSDRRAGIVIGGVLGVIGLVSVPLFVNASVLCLVAGLATRKSLGFLAFVFLPAAAVLTLWAGPVAIGFLRYGGFIDISPALGREWPVPAALESWGLLVPFAVAGVIVARRRRVPGSRVLLAYLAATALLIAVAVVRDLFDWQLLGVPSLLHRGRMWPTAHVLVAAFAGIALFEAARLAVRRRGLGALLAVLVLGVGALSPVLASIAVGRMITAHQGAFGYSSSDFAPGAFIRTAAARLDPADVVTSSRDFLSFRLWQYSGARVAHFDDPRLATNDLRIRFADLARAWQARVEHGGFSADYSAVLASQARNGRVVARGRYHGAEWVLVRLAGGRSDE